MSTIVTALPSKDIGLQEETKSTIGHELNGVLADTWFLRLKTQNFHWNGTGPQFYSFHKLTEAQYKELDEAADEIAERVRALGYPVPGTHASFGKLSRIREEEKLSNIQEMILILVQDHLKVIRAARDVATAAESAGDQASVDLLARRIGAHEKAAWMLRSILGQN